MSTPDPKFKKVTIIVENEESRQITTFDRVKEPAFDVEYVDEPLALVHPGYVSRRSPEISLITFQFKPLANASGITHTIQDIDLTRSSNAYVND